MGNKVILTWLFILLGINLFAQKSSYRCDYSFNANDGSSEACQYNKLYSYSKTSIDTQALQIITKICDLVSLPVNFGVEPCDGINTCRAFVYDNGERYVFYDRKFIRNITTSNGNDWCLIAMLAHELGHHLCGHSILVAVDPLKHRKSELQADQFAGAMLARMGANQNEAILSLTKVQHPLCDREDYEAYPCFDSRRDAVLKGFNSISLNSRNENFVLNSNLKSVDISSTFKNPVRNQGNDPACVGFTIAYAVENELYNTFGKSILISPRYIYNSIGGTATSGATIVSGLNFIKNKGAIDESKVPYKTGDYDSLVVLYGDTVSQRYKIKDYDPVPLTLENFKDELNKGKFLIVGIWMFENFLADNTGNWIYHDGIAKVGAKSMCIVGYDDEKGVFKFKNSWGPDWGDNGYGYIRYQDFNFIIYQAYIIKM
jgi:hypothetical protein